MSNLLSRDRLLIFSILAIGFGLRVVAVNFGLPHLYHADEPVVVNHALAYGTGDLNPHFFNIPPLVSYLLFFIYGLFYLFGQAVGWFSNVQDFENLFYADPTVFYLIARVLFGVVLGTMTVYALYRLVLRHFSRETALLSSFFLAACFLHVRDSHYIYVDIPLGFVMVLAFMVFLKIPEKRSESSIHVMAGAVIGLAVAVKYNGIALVIPYLAASFTTREFGRVLRGWLLSALVCIGVYAVLNPFSVIDFGFFLREVRSEARAHAGGIGWVDLLWNLSRGSVGAPLLVAGFFGLISPRVLRSPSKRCLVVFVVGYYVILKVWGQPYGRYVLPLVPFVLILAAEWVVTITQKMGRFRSMALGIGIVTLSVPMLARSVMFDRVMLRKDTRTLAKEWIEQNVPSDSGIATDLEFYMPRLHFAPFQLEEKMGRLEGRMFSEAQKRRLNFLVRENAKRPSYHLYSLLDAKEGETGQFLMAKPPVPYDVDDLKNKGIDYVIIARLWKKDLRQPFYDQLAKEGKLVAEFNPYRGGKQKWALEHPLTGGPFLWKDLLHRERNGQPLLIYRI